MRGVSSLLDDRWVEFRIERIQQVAAVDSCLSESSLIYEPSVSDISSQPRLCTLYNLVDGICEWDVSVNSIICNCGTSANYMKCTICAFFYSKNYNTINYTWSVPSSTVFQSNDRPTIGSLAHRLFCESGLHAASESPTSSSLCSKFVKDSLRKAYLVCKIGLK
jgi:hypothetical protein